MSEDTIDKPIEEVLQTGLRTPPRSISEEQPTEPAKTLLSAVPKVSIRECMGYVGPLGDIQKHYFSSGDPYVPGTTGLCEECLKVYRKEAQIRREGRIED